MTYLILWKEGYREVSLDVYATTDRANAALRRCTVVDFDEGEQLNGLVIDGIPTLTRLEVPTLVALYNGLREVCGHWGDPPDEVDNFQSIDDGARRVFSFIEELAAGMEVRT